MLVYVMLVHVLYLNISMDYTLVNLLTSSVLI